VVLQLPLICMSHAEIEITAELVRDLVRDQHPDRASPIGGPAGRPTELTVNWRPRAMRYGAISGLAWRADGQRTDTTVYNGRRPVARPPPRPQWICSTRQLILREKGASAALRPAETLTLSGRRNLNPTNLDPPTAVRRRTTDTKVAPWRSVV
jgi:hypothetical protein